MQIVGLDSHPFNRVTEIEEMLRDHIVGLKKNPWTKNSYILFFGERNVGHEIGHMQRIISEYDRTYTYKQPEKQFGIWTGAVEKISYAMATRREMAKKCVYYADAMVCTNRNYLETERRKKSVAEFEDQARRYRFITSKPKTAHSNAKLTVSGKVGKDGNINGSFNDDLFFAFTAAIGVHDKMLLKELPGMDYSLYKEPYAHR